MLFYIYIILKIKSKRSYSAWKNPLTASFHSEFFSTCSFPPNFYTTLGTISKLYTLAFLVFCHFHLLISNRNSTISVDLVYLLSSRQKHLRISCTIPSSHWFLFLIFLWNILGFSNCSVFVFSFCLPPHESVKHAKVIPFYPQLSQMVTDILCYTTLGDPMNNDHKVNSEL